MSADVWLTRPVCMTCGRGGDTFAYTNLTYNLSPMLREAGMPAWRDLMGMKASEAGQIWRRVHAALIADPECFKAMTPPNGWGTYELAVEVIGGLAEACELNPGATVGGWL